jgi:hypothetical protein
MPMIRVIQGLYRENNFFTAKHCDWFAEEAENYAYKDDDDKNKGENPVDFRNHLMDAHRYAICSVEKNYTGPMQFRRHPAHPNDMVAWNQRAAQRRPGESIKLPSIVDSLNAQDKSFEEKRRI